MVTQLPPLRIEYQAKSFSRDYHKIDESQNLLPVDECAAIKFVYLWPGLLDGGGKIIIRGRVAVTM